MKNKYIKNKAYYIKEDLTSVLLYFDYFSQGLSLVAKYTDSRLIRKFVDSTLRIIIILMFYSKLYRIFYKTVEINDNAIIIIKRKGRWANTIKLVNSHGKLKIVKKTFDKQKYLNEKNFYEKYKDNPTQLKLPRCKFLKDNTIEVEFIEAKFFQRLVIDGTLDFKKSLIHFKKIKRELKLLYKKDKNLIHGDLWLTNIYILGNKYYFIDYTDSHIQSLNYDLYLLSYSLLSSFKKGFENKKIKDNYSSKRLQISKLLNLKFAEVIKLENEYIIFRNKKLPLQYRI